MSKTNQVSAGTLDSGNHIPMSKKNKKLFFFASLTTLLLVSAIVGVSVGVNSRKNSGDGLHNVHSRMAHAIVKSACSSTMYPDLCFSAIVTEPGFARKVSTHKDIIELSLNITIRAAQHNYFNVRKLQTRKGLTKREKIALHDCLETIDNTLDELHRAIADLEDSGHHADDLKTLISAAITNQETCLDGFSHDGADKHVREGLMDRQLHVERMCSNALAMIKNMTDSEVSMRNRKLTEVDEAADGVRWPECISAGDRRLLQAPTVTPNVVVAADGSGNYRTVAEAVAAAPEGSSTRYVIRIKAGVYRENVEVTKKKTNIMFVGDGRTNTVITGNRNVVDGSTTFHSATVAVVGERFLARDITFQNTAGPSKHQAVALRVGADLSAFYRCDVLAYQDSLYVHSNRQFFINCLIAGTVDFIFGDSAVVLQDCDIHARRPNSGQKNMVTAQGRVDPNQNTGIVIHNCRIGATQDLLAVKGSVETYLGRPWKEYSRTVIMKSEISDVIQPEGWFPWEGNFALNTLFYGEYQNTGPGAVTSARVNWKGFRVITSATEAQSFTPGNFIAGSSWLRSTGFPFALGL
ncbi:pectinesterase-like [Prosopis cineraria]|uniref:pectinesterase-like n=1 Tax=Prosopis cineraria TaxID=364024 RepID=UPI00240FE6E0|nr:pectinesterase-like [Prosopis cineraria]